MCLAKTGISLCKSIEGATLPMTPSKKNSNASNCNKCLGKPSHLPIQWPVHYLATHDKWTKSTLWISPPFYFCLSCHFVQLKRKNLPHFPGSLLCLSIVPLPCLCEWYLEKEPNEIWKTKTKKTNDILSWQLIQTIWGRGEGGKKLGVIISTMTTQSNFFHLLENLITSLV